MGFTHRSQEDCGRCQGWMGGRYISRGSIHGTGIFPYVYHENSPNVAKYTIHG